MMVKWIGYVLLALVVAVVALVLYGRFIVGVNVPIGEGELNPDALSDRIQLPEGFGLNIYAADVPNARILRFTKQGDLLVANPSRGAVLIFSDNNGDGRADARRVLIDNLDGPNGLDFFGDYLYIAETHAIGRVPFDHSSGEFVGEYEHIVTGLPAGENHWKKTLRFGPDGLMYVAMGSSCNVCLEEDERRAALVRYQPDGSGEEIFALGLRNSAGFDWSPIDGEIYATDNGRDLLGDDFPPCELNKVVEGGHYGWPFVNGNNIPDPDFGEANDEIVARAIPPVHDFRAHNAPLGIEFIRGTTLPTSYHGAAIVALHGSWNRRQKDGYKVVSLHFGKDGSITEKDFVTGFLQDDDVIGRPAEVAEGPDGAIYIADDYAGAIYRVAYGEETQVIGLAAAPTEPQFDAEVTLAAIPDADRERLFGEGEKVFKQYFCISCHNDSGRGLKPLEKLGERYDIAAIDQFLKKPTPPMPIFPLSESDREALAVYLISTYR